MVAATAEELAVRCIGCGKPVEDGEKSFRIAKGSIDGGEFDEHSEYGNMHEGCFHRAIESPRSVLEEVRRISRKQRRRRT